MPWLKSIKHGNFLLILEVFWLITGLIWLGVKNKPCQRVQQTQKHKIRPWELTFHPRIAISNIYGKLGKIRPAEIQKMPSSDLLILIFFDETLGLSFFFILKRSDHISNIKFETWFFFGSP